MVSHCVEEASACTVGEADAAALGGRHRYDECIAWQVAAVSWVSGAFEAYLRVGELCRLRGSDILLPGDSVDSYTNCGLRIRVAKTGRNQFARVRNPKVIKILRYLKLVTPPEGYVMCGATGQQFNTAIQWATVKLGLTDHFTMMYSLRYGRATMGFLGGDTSEKVRLDGRWASQKSMENLPPSRYCVVADS